MKDDALDYLVWCLPNWVDTAMAGPHQWAIPVNIDVEAGTRFYWRQLQDRFVGASKLLINQRVLLTSNAYWPHRHFRQ